MKVMKIQNVNNRLPGDYNRRSMIGSKDGDLISFGTNRKYFNVSANVDGKEVVKEVKSFNVSLAIAEFIDEIVKYKNNGFKIKNIQAKEVNDNE